MSQLTDIFSDDNIHSLSFSGGFLMTFPVAFYIRTLHSSLANPGLQKFCQDKLI